MFDHSDLGVDFKSTRKVWLVGIIAPLCRLCHGNGAPCAGGVSLYKKNLEYGSDMDTTEGWWTTVLTMKAMCVLTLLVMWQIWIQRNASLRKERVVDLSAFFQSVG